jgi:enoyl-[acyl-carrier protein] reductase/trans-2-enoyl-CoA reductase (NAD+)
VQAKVTELWPLVTESNLFELTDFKGYTAEFLKLFGFGQPSVDYDADTNPEILVRF